MPHYFWAHGVIILVATILGYSSLFVAFSIHKSASCAVRWRKHVSTPQSEYQIQHTSSGCVYTPADTPVCVVDNVCWQQGLVTYHIAPFDWKRWPWQAEKNLTVDSQSSLMIAWNFFAERCCQHFANNPDRYFCLRAAQLGFTCCRQLYASRNEPRLLNTSTKFLEQNAFALDTAVNFFQFGHATSKILQFASLALWAIDAPLDVGGCQRPLASYGIFSCIKGLDVPNTLKEWLAIVAGLYSSSTNASAEHALQFTTLDRAVYGAPRLQPCQSKGTCLDFNDTKTCAQRAFFIHDYETIYFRRTDAERANEEAERILGLKQCPKDSESARRHGMMLLRREGSGGRKFVNDVQVREAIQMFFNLHLKNVTIDSTMGAKQQISHFRDHRLIIASHSSQLKNLAFACPCTIVIEVTAMDGHHNPFAAGLNHRNIAYVQSVGHSAETYGRPTNSHDPLELRIWDVVVNISRLRSDLVSAVKMHRQSGCNVF